MAVGARAPGPSSRAGSLYILRPGLLEGGEAPLLGTELLSEAFGYRAGCARRIAYGLYEPLAALIAKNPA